MEIKNRDRISELPEPLIQQILSYLPTEEAARTTVLSKTWLQSYSTSPILRFDEYYFPRPTAIEEEDRYPFFNFVNNTLLRYTSLNLRIHKFQIKVFHVDHRLLDKSLGVAFDNGVQELDISVMYSLYTLPATMFHSPKLLTYLRARYCKFPQNFATTSQLRNPVIFPFLKTLNLVFANIDDGMLQTLLSSSPSLEKILLYRVSGFNKFRVTNLSKLKIVNIDMFSTDMPIEVDIEGAASLRLLKFWGSDRCPCLLKVDSVPSLKCLELHSVSIRDDFLEGLIRKSPLLEDLEIDACNGLERINIVSDSLKHFQFWRCEKVVEVKINAPSLLELQHRGGNMLSLSLNNTPEGLRTHIQIYDCFNDQPINNAWFHQLRELLRGVTRGKLSFGILHQNQGIEIGSVHNISVNPLPPKNHAEDIMPEIDQSSSWLAAFVETLFSSSRPTIIDSPGSLTPSFADFENFLGSELIAATRNPNCCSSDQTKCWRHYLKDIKVKVYDDSKKVWQPLHLQETPLSEFTFSGKWIRFRLKWYANLNAKAN